MNKTDTLPANTDGTSSPVECLKRDFNSSTDTYVSEPSMDENADAGAEDILPDSSQTASSDHTTPSLQPLSDPVPPELKADSYDPKTSPTKSSIKSAGNSSSPRKSVAFPQTLETLHTYTPRPDESASPSAAHTPINHDWEDLETSFSPLDVTSSPPPPPPHTSNTITGLLNTTSITQNDLVLDDEHESSLRSFKESEKSFNKLSLNDKLNVFLDSKTHAEQDDLLDHLDQLNMASERETDVNIHQLTHQILPSRQSAMENPLDALSHSLGLYLNLVHSSQSSLQSLRDSNRNLHAEFVAKSSQGAEFSDGIRGFLDVMAGHLISGTANSSNSSIGDPSDAKPESLGKLGLPRDTSFDKSYNLTERHIMNLLDSASQLDLISREKGSSTNDDEPRTSLRSESILDNKQNHDEGLLDAPESKTIEPSVKIEPEDCLLKSEPDRVSENLASLKAEDLELTRIDKSQLSMKREPGDSMSQVVEQQTHDVNIKREMSQQSMGKLQHDENVTNMSDTDKIAIKKEAQDYTEKEIELSPVNAVSSTHDQPSALEASRIHLSDNDSTFEHGVKLETLNHRPDQSSSDSDVSADYKDSVDMTARSLAPPRSMPPSPEKANTLPQQSVTRGMKSEEQDTSILANSSNLNPPINIALPNFDSKSDSLPTFSKRTNDTSSSFEESLSAEHDAEKNNLDFLSIWHSQLLSRNGSQAPKKQFYNVPSLLSYNTADLSQRGKYHIPRSLQPKKFLDVNLVSTRVVSANHEDLNISGFLPEISQDSGLEDHFRSLMMDQVSHDGDSASRSKDTRRRKSMDQNILAELDHSNQKSTSERRRRSIHTLRPTMNLINKSKATESPKKSRFHVPSFEIKRSNSVLSPKNFYNDIFQDTSGLEPTIKAQGMKTLPSMDREDVKRIMQMKQAMTQEEYSSFKKVGARTKSSTKHESRDKYALLQQAASIDCASVTGDLAKSTVKPSPSEKTLEQHPLKEYSHVRDEISYTPIAIDAKDLLAADKNPFNTKPLGAQVQQNGQKTEAFAFPEPDPELISLPTGSPKIGKFSRPPPTIDATTETRVSPHNPFRVPSQKGIEGTAKMQPSGRSSLLVNQKEETIDTKEGRKSAKGSPIKIGSPVKIVRVDGSVTGVVLDKKPRSVGDGPELVNKKLRTDRTNNGLSAVSVPSNIMSEVLSQSGDLDLEVMRRASQNSKHLVSLKVFERGKLFFRVVGLKNVNLPEIKDRNISFNMTLDNGVHCIKTPNYMLDSPNVLVGKEFELVVSDSLQFILTMKATYSKQKPGYKEVRERKVVKSKNKFVRIFGSKEIITTTKFVPQERTDPLEKVFATDGSFARCYVDLEQFESQISGQACNFHLTCFNEWETYSQNGEQMLRKPYQVGQLEVKMLFIPRTEEYEILPMSIKAAYESLDDLKKESSLTLEGYLHQEGGDCALWKRRWFKLCGTSLIAHSEFSHKTRAKINLAKVVELIFVDKENINRSSDNYRNFSDILLMDHAFKIRFANGEIIDFGAPTKEEKLRWIKTIQEIVYRNKFRRQPWVKLMQAINGDKRLSWISKS